MWCEETVKRVVLPCTSAFEASGRMIERLVTGFSSIPTEIGTKANGLMTSVEVSGEILRETARALQCPSMSFNVLHPCDSKVMAVAFSLVQRQGIFEHF